MKHRLIESVKRVDPTLDFVQELFSRTGKTFPCLVYKVERAGKPYVLKIGQSNSIENIKVEKTVLRKMSYIDQVCGLAEDYGHVDGGRYYAILKEWTDGEHPASLTDEQGKSLRKLVKKFHKKGIANLDTFRADNVLFDGERIRLFDFDVAMLRETTPENLFKKAKEMDLKNLRHYS